MIATTASTSQRLREQDRRVEQHPHRDEEQHREGVPQRQGLLGRAVAQVRLAHHHAREERAERERHAEQLGGAVGDAERRAAMTASVNSSREPVSSTRWSSHGKTRAPTTSISDGEQRDLAQRERRASTRGCPARPAAVAAPSAERPGQRRAAARGRAPSRGPPRPASPPRCGRRSDSSRPRSSSARSSTTVLATDSARPNTRPAPSAPAPRQSRRRCRAPCTAICARRPAARRPAPPGGPGARSACRRRT